MTALWDLLPPAIVTRAKAIVAVIGVTGFIVVSFFPSLAVNHYVAAAIAVLTALGVWGVPNQNARTLLYRPRRREPVVLPPPA
jgi:hypothetical protein